MSVNALAGLVSWGSLARDVLAMDALGSRAARSSFTPRVAPTFRRSLGSERVTLAPHHL